MTLADRLEREARKLREATPDKRGVITTNPASAAALADDLGQAAARIRALEEGIKAFLAKHEECDPHIANAFFMAHNLRGGRYTGPSYAEELKALRSLLREGGE